MLLDIFKTKRKAKSSLKNLSLKERREIYKDMFFETPMHHWIASDPSLIKVFGHLIDSFDKRTMTFLETSKQVVFLHTPGTMGSALSSLEKYHVIIIYPDLVGLLKSASMTHGMSVLAHELGHIIGKHSYRNMTPLEAQIEADQYACELGYGHELQDTLLEQSESIDTRVRVSFITTYMLTNKQLEL